MTLFVYWCTAWSIGIWLSSSLSFPSYIWAVGAMGTLFPIALIRSPKARLSLSCVLLVALGAIRYNLTEPHFDDRSLVNYNGARDVTLVGVVSAEPDVRDEHIFYKLDMQSLVQGDAAAEGLAVHGAARIKCPRYPVYAYGDRLRVYGDLETPRGWDDFDYRDYLARKGIFSYVQYPAIELLDSGGGSAWKRAMFAFKDHAQQTIARILPEPEASLLTGILLGIESGIPDDTMEAFSATGTTHVIVISGFNISIAAGLLMATVGRILPDRRMAAVIAILGVVGYTLLVGADAAVVRAAAMGVVTLVGLAVNRQGVAFNSLAVAVIAMTAINPNTLWDVGFQLSVAATLGIALYAELFDESFRNMIVSRFSGARTSQFVGWIGELLLLTVVAQVFTTPIILKYFGRLSTVSLLSNLLVQPVQPLILFIGGSATLVGLVFEPLGRVVGWGAFLWLTWTIRAVEWSARFPRASVPLVLSDLGLIAFYLGVGVTVRAVRVSPRRWLASFLGGVRARFPLKATLAGMALVSVVAWLAVSQFPDGKLAVTFLNVGQGDAIFVETPGGAQILIDGGPNGSDLLSELGRQMPFWDRTLDMVVLTHPDGDHLTGLISVLERYRVGVVVQREPADTNNKIDAWEAALAAGEAELVRGQAGTHMELSDGVVIEILHPGPNPMESDQDNANNDSIVLRLSYQDVAFLLSGDIEAEVEWDLVRSGTYLRSTVLKVPHHGSQTSSSQAFLEAVRPQVAVISVGEDNKFGHPADDVLKRLEGVIVHRTDQDGRVTVTSDGHRLWIETER